MRDRFFPFHSIGFECNPFRALSTEEWGEVVVLPQELLEQVRDDQVCIQILGDSGCGKTALLRGLESWFRSRNIATTFLYLSAGETELSERPRSGEVYLLDEAQRLEKGSWKSLRESIKTGIRVIWTSHVDLTEAGVSLNLMTHRIHTDPENILEVIQRRLERFTIDQPPKIYFTEDAAGYLQAKFDGDFRSIVSFLYRFFQSFPDPGPVSEDVLKRYQARFISSQG